MRLEPCLKLLGCWDSGGVSVASAALGVMPPCEDGMTSCGSEGSSISALCFGSFVSTGVGMGFGEGTANKNVSFLDLWLKNCALHCQIARLWVLK